MVGRSGRSPSRERRVQLTRKLQYLVANFAASRVVGVPVRVCAVHARCGVIIHEYIGRSATALSIAYRYVSRATPTDPEREIPDLRITYYDRWKIPFSNSIHTRFKSVRTVCHHSRDWRRPHCQCLPRLRLRAFTPPAKPESSRVYTRPSGGALSPRERDGCSVRAARRRTRGLASRHSLSRSAHPAYTCSITHKLICSTVVMVARRLTPERSATSPAPACTPGRWQERIRGGEVSKRGRRGPRRRWVRCRRGAPSARRRRRG